jgi:hypothetical protein
MASGSLERDMCDIIKAWIDGEITIAIISLGNHTVLAVDGDEDTLYDLEGPLCGELGLIDSEMVLYLCEGAPDELEEVMRTVINMLEELNYRGLGYSEN